MACLNPFVSLLFSVIQHATPVGFAQAPRPGDPEYFANGHLVTLRVVPKDKMAEVYVTGREVANARWKSRPRVLSVTLVRGGERQTLEFAPNGEAFRVYGTPGRRQSYELNLNVGNEQQSEELQLKVGPSHK